MKKRTFLGIDVSKAKLDACIYGKGTKEVFDNNSKGLKKMIIWLERNLEDLQDLVICFEHTGMYDLPLQLFCEDKGLHYTKVSGLQVKRSLGIQRGKNDQIDAFRLAEYAFLHKDKLRMTTLGSKQLVRLKYLLSYRSRLARNRASFKTSMEQSKEYLGLCNSDVLIKNQQKMIRVYTKQIQEIENEIIQQIDQHHKIKHQYQLATSVKGIGMITAAYMIVYTNCFEDFDNARKFACYVGSAPFEHSSGTSIHGQTRISHYANKTIKALLTNAALAAINHDPEIRQYFKKKIDEGKHKKIVINNVRNKLIGRVFATITRGTPYVSIAQYAA